MAVELQSVVHARSLPYVASVYKRRTATLSLVPAHLLRYFVLLYICDIVDPALD